ncbi:MAG: nitroreductase family protein [Candidatus Omnitrophica bacterium]|nr:nitroreductase family protein [Candidatus Omnitrophota bacterium]
MDLFETIKTRRSIRSFQDVPIEQDVLRDIIEAGRYAPTARGEEPWEFVAVTDRAVLGQLGSIADHGSFIAQAAACVAVACTPTKYYLEDGSAATENIMLAARGYGIGSCWVAGDKKEYCPRVLEALNIPASYKLISLIALGYPRDEKEFMIKQKRPLQELLHWEKF